MLNRQAAGLLSIMVAAALLVVGLWPFKFRPTNRVHWLKDQPGLSFQPDAIAYDPEPAVWCAGGSPDQPASFTLELWLQPASEPDNDVFHILTIDDGQYPSGTVLCQWGTELLLRVRDSANDLGFREVSAIGALAEQTPRLITVTAGPSGTAFHLNGLPFSRFPDFLLPGSRLKGRLILGNAAEGKHAWTGCLFGLAIFNRVLDAPQIAEHHTIWTKHQADRMAAESGLAALYLFDEGSGQTAQDRSANRRRLWIPQRYRVLQKHVLELPWGATALGMSDLDDIAMNLLGFMPFGFIVLNYRRLAKPGGGAWSLVWATVAGATISLTIELTQVWLPNRCSSATDLLCNTLGTFLGALIAGRVLTMVTHVGSGCEKVKRL